MANPLSLFKLFLFGVLALILASCGANPTKNALGPLPQSAEQAFIQGQSLYQQWYNSETPEFDHIAQAEKLLAYALDAQPDNARYQISQYNAFAMLNSYSLLFDEQTLLNKFNKLEPTVRAESITPAFAAYSISSDENAPIETQIRHLLRAVEQNPNNPANWMTLSQLYLEANQYWLSASAAQNTLKLAPESAQANYILGLNLSLAAQAEHCPSQAFGLLKSSAKYFSKSSQLVNDNTYYVGLTSEAYLRLGLTPIALAQAKKAYEIQSNSFTRAVLFNALFYSRQFDEAWLVLTEMLAEGDSDTSRLELMRLWYMQETQAYAAEKQMEFAELAINSIDKSTDLSTLLLAYTLVAHYMNEPIDDSFPEVSETEHDMSAIVEYMLKDTLDSNDFVSAAKNSCSRNRRAFYPAFKQWLETGKNPDKHTLSGDQKTINTLANEEYWSLLLAEYHH